MIFMIFIGGLILFGSPAIALWLTIDYLTSD